jgi:hypothetical protein
MKTDNLDEDQLPHLGTFSKAAEFSNFTAAAGSLDLTQAAVSQRIQALEKRSWTYLCFVARAAGYF